jgi:hypothetical protein
LIRQSQHAIMGVPFGIAFWEVLLCSVLSDLSADLLPEIARVRCRIKYWTHVARSSGFSNIDVERLVGRFHKPRLSLRRLVRVPSPPSPSVVFVASGQSCVLRLVAWRAGSSIALYIYITEKIL